MKQPKLARLSFRSLLAAAALGVTAGTVHASWTYLNYYTGGSVGGYDEIYLYNTNTINGTISVNNYIQTDFYTNTTFNGNVYGTTYLSDDSTVNYGALAQLINGGIYSRGGFSGYNNVLNFRGKNVVNGTIDLNDDAVNGPFAQINIRGTGVVFNGNVSGVDGINFTGGYDLTLGNGISVYSSNGLNFNGNNATLNVEDGVNIYADITTSTDKTGTINFAEDAYVSGSVGSGASFSRINLDGTGAYVRIDGMVHADTLMYNAGASLELNSGIEGTVDFNNKSGVLALGDNVNLTVGTGDTVFANANNAALVFNGSSIVNGDVGAAFSGTNPASTTFESIYAGANGENVKFLGKVYVSKNTFHVSGTGTVEFTDNLVGPLVFDADGTAIFADKKGVVGIGTTPGNGNVSNYGTTPRGNLEFLGSTTLDGTIGGPNGDLSSVHFHSGTTATNVTQAINYNIYATNTFIGNAYTVGTNPTTTTAIIGKDNIHLGSYVDMVNEYTTLYTAGTQTLVDLGGPDNSVNFTHTKNADGTLSLPIGTITHSTFTNDLYTRDGTLGFAVSAAPFNTAPSAANGVIAADATSSQISATTPSSYLNMSSLAHVQVALLGSVRDAETYNLIDVANGGYSPSTSPYGYILDNSYTIDTTLSRNSTDADLVLTTHRDADTYLSKSGTKLLGLRSYDMAYRLGQLAAAGTGYSAGLQVVFNKLDLDQWGYGNNEANLARQLYLLTPSGDGAAVKAGTGLTAQAVGAVLDGSNSLSTRATPQRSYWVRAYGSHDNQSGSGEFAGYNINGGGVTVGTDYSIGDSVVGLAVGYGKAKATSRGARDGDTADVDSTIAGLFFRTPIGQYFLNAMIDGAKHRTKTERQSAVGERANGDYTGTEFGGAIQLGRKFELSDKNESLTPILSVNYSRYKQEAYAETGAGDIGLSYTEQKYTQSDARLSLRYAVEKSLGEGISSSFSAALGYKHLLSSPTYNNTVAFVGDAAGGSYDMAGFNETHKGSLTASLAYNYNPSKGVTYTIDYNGEVKSGYNAHSVGFRATWEY